MTKKIKNVFLKTGFSRISFAAFLAISYYHSSVKSTNFKSFIKPLKSSNADLKNSFGDNLEIFFSHKQNSQEDINFKNFSFKNIVDFYAPEEQNNFNLRKVLPIFLGLSSNGYNNAQNEDIEKYAFLLEQIWTPKVSIRDMGLINKKKIYNIFVEDHNEISDIFQKTVDYYKKLNINHNLPTSFTLNILEDYRSLFFNNKPKDDTEIDLGNLKNLFNSRPLKENEKNDSYKLPFVELIGYFLFNQLKENLHNKFDLNKDATFVFSGSAFSGAIAQEIAYHFKREFYQPENDQNANNQPGGQNANNQPGGQNANNQPGGQNANEIPNIKTLTTQAIRYLNGTFVEQYNKTLSSENIFSLDTDRRNNVTNIGQASSLGANTHIYLSSLGSDKYRLETRNEKDTLWKKISWKIRWDSERFEKQDIVDGHFFNIKEEKNETKVINSAKKAIEKILENIEQENKTSLTNSGLGADIFDVFKIKNDIKKIIQLLTFIESKESSSNALKTLPLQKWFIKTSKGSKEHNNLNRLKNEINKNNIISEGVMELKGLSRRIKNDSEIEYFANIPFSYYDEETDQTITIAFNAGSSSAKEFFDQIIVQNEKANNNALNNAERLGNLLGNAISAFHENNKNGKHGDLHLENIRFDINSEKKLDNVKKVHIIDIESAGENMNGNQNQAVDFIRFLAKTFAHNWKKNIYGASAEKIFKSPDITEHEHTGPGCFLNALIKTYINGLSEDNFQEFVIYFQNAEGKDINKILGTFKTIISGLSTHHEPSFRITLEYLKQKIYERQFQTLSTSMTDSLIENIKIIEELKALDKEFEFDMKKIQEALPDKNIPINKMIERSKNKLDELKDKLKKLEAQKSIFLFLQNQGLDKEKQNLREEILKEEIVLKKYTIIQNLEKQSAAQNTLNALQEKYYTHEINVKQEKLKKDILEEIKQSEIYKRLSYSMQKIFLHIIMPMLFTKLTIVAGKFVASTIAQKILDLFSETENNESTIMTNIFDHASKISLTIFRGLVSTFEWTLDCK